MEKLPVGQRQLSDRTAFWVVFLTLVLVCLGFLLPGKLRRYGAARTCEQLRFLIGKDARFNRVQVSCATNGRAIVSGTVNSSEDATTLRFLIVQAQTPQLPVFAVQVLTSINNDH